MRFFYEAVNAQVTFVKDAQGQVTHIVHHQDGTCQVSLGCCDQSMNRLELIG